MWQKPRGRGAELYDVSMDFSNSFYWYGLTLIPAWIINHMLRKVWDEINYPFIKFNGCTIHGGPSEAGDCSDPPPKMATAENPTSGKATFDHVIGTGSLRFFACEQVLDIANPRYSNGRSSRGSLASQGACIFSERQVTRSKEAGDSPRNIFRRRVTLHGGWWL